MFSPQYRKRGIRETTCAATGTICRNTTTNLRIDDHTFQSLYCQFHACRQIEAGRACAVAKPPSAIVCSQHSRCQAVDNGMGCALDVKDGNAAMHKYCMQLHLCGFPECENERSKRNEQYIPFCVDHRCEQDNCRNYKDVGIFCIDLDDPQRFCDRHRQCEKPQCPRLCHTRDNGQPSPFCGAHYCQAPDCEDGREAGLFCPAHTCAELGCLKGRESFKTEYCKSHKCKTKHCRLRRLDSGYCPYHECVYDGCGAEVVEGRLCEAHRRRMKSSFGRRLSTQGMGYAMHGDEEDVAEELNMAISSVNTICVRSTIARLQGLDHPTSASITGALQWDVMNPGRYNPKSGFEATPKGCSVKSMLVAMLVVKTKTLKIQIDACGTEEATCQDLDQGWTKKMRG
ncbi:hypothetical protein FPSE_08493 [Fusarium pseudograminearum CS3096]|uniref:Uncharacterized protein n=1 Tax=Fusarium pseudograminearum (strain CS3096) TaxID=1028729 RepID=K3VCA7_FUSPC|nr:hypothetical protein FPSE_08493 [Fusarium pseudograminearum CS3096]EKJ71254.1 hypothetical protein FPSE_08493 [Fusarium pseudograminearum CS3096]